jgi:amino acid adenylation domain-containing protein
LILDGWSVGLLVPEILAIYAALRVGHAPALAPACSFAPYVRWFSRRDMAETLAYWRDQLDGFDTPTIIPRDRHEQDTDSNEVEAISVALRESEERAVYEAARSQGCTPFTMIAAAWAVVLATATGRHDVMFGTTVSGRPCSLPTVESMVGLFINTIPFRATLDPAERIRSWLRRLEDQKQIAVDQHAYASLAEILKPLSQGRGRTDGSPFNTLLVYENYPLPQFLQVSPDLTLRDIHCTERTNYDLTLIVVPSPRFEFTLNFDGSRHTRLAIHRLLGRLRAVVKRLCELSIDEAQSVGDLLEPDAAERHRALVEYARGGRSEPSGNGAFPPAGADRIEQLIWARMREGSAESIAVSCGQAQWSYAYLYARAVAVARRLAEIGLRPDDRVGLCVRRGPWLVAGALGILEAGGCYVPIDVNWPPERRRWVAADAGLKAVLVDEDSPRFSWGASEVMELMVGADAKWAGAPPSAGTPPSAARNSRDLAYVIYTSGSTGAPKGVMVEHAGVVNRLQWMQRAYPLRPRDRVLQKTPATFDVSVWELFWPLMTGARVVLAAPDGHRDTRYLAQELRRRRIGTVHFVPSMLNMLLEDPGLAACGGRSRSLRRVICSGEALSGELMRRFWASADAAGFHWAEGQGEGLFNLYGPTEASVDVSAWSCEQPQGEAAVRAWAPDAHAASVPIGRPIDGIQLFVLGPQLQALPPGAIGELCIGGVGVARGYLARPSLTARSFVPAPWSVEPGQRLYCTGDLARWRADGSLDYLGRIDHQVKIRGVRVEPDEVAQTILRHPSIRSAAVAPLSKPGVGIQLVAYVVRSDREASWPAQRDEIMKWLRDRLPDHLIPTALVDMPDGLPLSENGKLDRRALPPPQDSAVEKSAWEHGAHLSTIEETIAELWIDALGLTPGLRLRADDSFFDLGGDSLTSLKAAARMSSCFAIELPVATLWAAPTIRAAAQEVEKLLAVSGGAPHLAVPRVDTSRPAILSNAQQRLWIAHQLHPEGTQHNVSGAVWLDGPLDEAALASALNHLAERHETLRTEFFERQGAPFQRILPDCALPLNVREVAGDDAETERACLDFAHEQMRVPFDLRRSPAARATLLRRSPTKHAFVLTLHHIACDGGSSAILLRDLCAFYDALSSGGQPALPPPAMRYVDYAAWQNSMLRTPAAQSDLAYWRRQLQGVSADHGLSVARGATSDVGLSASVLRRLAPELTKHLRVMKQAHGVTMFMLMLTAFKALLHDLTGRTDIAVGADVSDRRLAGSWDVVGFFVNQLTLRTSLDGDPSYASLIKRVRDTCVEGYARQSVPYETLVKELRPDRRQDRALFQVKLVQQRPLPLSFNIGELFIRPMPVSSAAAEFDLIINMAEDIDTLALEVEFRSDRFTSDGVSRMLDRLETILATSVANASLRLSELTAAARAGGEPELALLPGRRRIASIDV